MVQWIEPQYNNNIPLPNGTIKIFTDLAEGDKVPTKYSFFHCFFTFALWAISSLATG